MIKGRIFSSTVKTNLKKRDNQEPIEKLKMSGMVGNIGQFAESIEQWSSYTERLFLQITLMRTKIGPTFNLLRSLLQPGTFLLKPLVITQRFRCHRRNQKVGESGTMFAVA